MPNALGFGESLLLKAAGGTGVNYVLELHGLPGNEFYVIPLPSQPESISCTRSYGETPVYTFDPDYVYREIAKQRGGSISVSGRAGVYSRLGLRYDFRSLKGATTTDVSKIESGKALDIAKSVGNAVLDIFGDSGGVFYGDGESHMKEFHKFCQKYHEYAAEKKKLSRTGIFDLNKTMNNEDQPYLVFRALKENIHVRVAIQNFTWSKAKDSTRMSYAWTLNLNIYDDHNNGNNPFAIEFIQDLLGGFNRAIENLNGKIFLLSRVLPGLANQVTSPLGETVKQLNNTFKGVNAVANSPGVAVSSLRNAVSNALGVISNALEYTLGVRSDNFFGTKVLKNWSDYSYFDGSWGFQRLGDTIFYVTSGGDADDFESVPNDIDVATSSYALKNEALIVEELMQAIHAAAGYLNLAKTLIDSSQFNATGFLNRNENSWSGIAALFDDRSNIRKNTPANFSAVNYTLRTGENLINIAEKVMGTRELWTVLAELNNCTDAFTRADGSPLSSGSVILIPTNDNSLILTFLPNVEGERGSKIGVDFLLDDSGDFVLDDMDFKLVKDVANLKQAVKNRLQTRKGELTHNPNFGLSDIIGNKNVWSAQYIAMHIRDQLLQDGRFLDVKDIEIDEQGDELFVKITAFTIQKQNLTFKTGV